jgi:methylamine dehydrogenase heavy chain
MSKSMAMPANTLRLVPAFVAAMCALLGASQAQLPVESTTSVETLPEKYPTSWLFAHDLAFYALATGRVYIVDPTAKTSDVYGMVDAAAFASFSYSRDRGELYVAETFYTRGMRGDRTDYLTVYDMATLAISAQVELPGAKRSLSVTQKAALQVTRDGEFLLVYNFTPAASVSIFDLNSRQVINEIPIPGCSLIYPHGDKGFASFCADGSMIAFDLDENGKPLNEYRTVKFNDIDADPLFMKFATDDDVAYFVSYKGFVQPVRLAGGEPEVLDRMYLGGAVRQTNYGAGARPAGWQVITQDRSGRIYILMRPDAGDGDHKSGGSYVWVFDPKSGRVVREIPLAGNSISIEVTGGRNQKLVATNEGMFLDIYDLKSGEHERIIGGWGPASPFALHAVQ